MYRFTLFIFITFAFLSCNAQPSYNLSCLQGMWENITNGSNDDDNINFIIYRNNKSMSFGYNEALRVQVYIYGSSRTVLLAMMPQETNLLILINFKGKGITMYSQESNM